MDPIEAQERLVSRIDPLMRRGGPALVIRRNQWPTAMRIVALHVKDAVEVAPRSAEAAEPGPASALEAAAALEVDTDRLTEAEIAVIHPILWDAGQDDAMEYSHLDVSDPDDLPEDACLGVVFNRADDGARLVLRVLEALGIPLDEVDASA